MSKVKAKHNKLNKPEDGNFGKLWNYICDQHGVAECFEEGFFDPMSGNLMAGDIIRILEIQTNRIRSMSEGIVLEVVKTKQRDSVDFFPLSTKILKFPLKTYDAPAEDEEVPAEYIKGTGTVKYNPGKKAYMISCDGKVVSQCANSERAHGIARGDFPIPVYE